MKHLIGVVSLILLLQGCASFVSPGGLNDRNCISLIECAEVPVVLELPTHEKLKQLPPATNEDGEIDPFIVAVYQFLDKTGQRKQSGGVALFSTAVSQGGETMLIDALKTAAEGRFFRVVERVGIDHLTRERQIVKTTRQAYDQETPLAPLLFAGMIIEGGIIGYDTNIETGGHGARYLGIGAQQAYRRDVVVVHLRAVSTLTGEILLNVQTSKTILSVAQGFDVFKFVEMDTQLVEVEDGMTENESVTRSVRSAIEASVYELIVQGSKRGFWKIASSNDLDNKEETVNENVE